jgi:hypothetical protein
MVDFLQKGVYSAVLRWLDSALGFLDVLCRKKATDPEGRRAPHTKKPPE